VTGEARATRCHAFGLAIDLLDGIACEGLAQGHCSGYLPPTVVRLAPSGHIEDNWPADRSRTTRQLRVAGDLIFSVAHAPGVGYLLTMPAFGRFLVDEDGMSILCRPTVAEWSTALLVQGLPLACTLRGLEPFHASGVALGGRALMVSAPVLGGKSSLAAHLVNSGATLLSDDVVALDVSKGVVRAHPGARWLHLRPPEDARIAASHGGRLRPVGSDEGRRRYEAPLAADPQPLSAVYLLERGRADAPAIVPARSSGLALIAATYNLSVREPSRLQRQLDLAHRMTGELDVFRVVASPAADARDHARLLREHFESQVLSGLRT
jgi:hypothetical protein